MQDRKFIIRRNKDLPKELVGTLFRSVGWESDCSDEMLAVAMSNSTHIITAWVDGMLVGLVRSMDDDLYSANIDCLVVHKDYRHMGVGTALVATILDDMQHIKYINVAPNEAENNGFYERFGFAVVKNSSLLQIVNY